MTITLLVDNNQTSLGYSFFLLFPLFISFFFLALFFHYLIWPVLPVYITYGINININLTFFINTRNLLYNQPVIDAEIRASVSFPKARFSSSHLVSKLSIVFHSSLPCLAFLKVGTSWALSCSFVSYLCVEGEMYQSYTLSICISRR